MSEMIDRLASAICRIPQTPNPTYADFARIAIEVMREPTENMIFEGAKMGGEECNMSDARSIWEAMIDAALAVSGDRKPETTCSLLD